MWGRRGRIPGADNDEIEDLYDACYPPMPGIGDVAAQMKARRREKMTLDALEDLMVHLAGIREERKAVVAVSEGWRLYRRDDKLGRPLEGTEVRPGDILLRPPRPQPSDTAQLQGSPRVKCETDRMALAALDHEFRLQRADADRQSRQRDVLSRVRARTRGVRCPYRTREAALIAGRCREPQGAAGYAAYFWPSTLTGRRSSIPTTSTARCAASWTTCRRTT